MPSYDFILVGGGAAGLSLAYRLARSPLRHRSMLIVDRDAKDRNDRTWGFWTDRPTLFDSIVSRSWSRLRFITQTMDASIPLGAYRYQMIRGMDFYRFVRQEVVRRAPVDIMQGVVDRIEDGPDGARITVDGCTYAGAWVFDSRFPPSSRAMDAGQYHTLQQHFTGWEIATSRPAFNPEVATLLDFRTAQAGAMRFFYVLPITAQRAFVEHVVCTPLPRERPAHEQVLAAYLAGTLGLSTYEIAAREGGTSPLTDRPCPRRLSPHVMSIGVLGGQIKPTSGYAFMRIQRDSAAIVASLLRHGHPFQVPHSGWRFRRYDAALLEIMAHRGEEIASIFTALFTRNPIGRIFRFLDEQSSPWDDLRVAATLPPGLALRALAPWAGPTWAEKGA
jgi:lycopene beta-cyclase